MIKQIELFDSVSVAHSLSVAQGHYEDLVPLQWGAPTLNEQQLRALDHLNHQKDRSKFVEEQEKVLSNLVSDGWIVIATYSMGDGMRGCHMILYKPESEVLYD
jgi:hypothetical protein